MKRAETINKFKQIFAPKSICLLSRPEVKSILKANNIKFSEKDIDKLLKIFCGEPLSIQEIEIKLTKLLITIEQREKQKEEDIPF